MDIRTNGIGPNDWAVFAEWYGEVRIVHRGDVFACLEYVRTHS
jgi:hypothetical protein